MKTKPWAKTQSYYQSRRRLDSPLVKHDFGFNRRGPAGPRRLEHSGYEVYIQVLNSYTEQLNVVRGPAGRRRRPRPRGGAGACRRGRRPRGILYYDVPYCILLYSTLLYSTILRPYHNILYYNVLYYTILYFAIL